MGLTQILSKSGFKYDSYIKNYYNFNCVIFCFWKQLILKYKMPFVKCSILRLKNQNLTYAEGWQKVIKKCSDYPIEIIEKNLLRTKIKSSIKFPKFYLYLKSFIPAEIKILLHKIV